jgi:hypothetical protein
MVVVAIQSLVRQPARQGETFTHYAEACQFFCHHGVLMNISSAIRVPLSATTTKEEPEGNVPGGSYDVDPNLAEQMGVETELPEDVPVAPSHEDLKGEAK